MAKRFLFIFSAVAVFCASVRAQDTKVSVKKGVPYCQAQIPGREKVRELCFDFYEPAGTCGDTLRPLVITVFGGGFVLGSRDHEDMVHWGNSLARKGFAVASIDYRLIPVGKFAAKELVRAGYMAAQDVSAAVRFFKAHAREYRIDTNRIYLLGQSAGAVAALHALYLDEDERPAVTFESPELSPLHSQGAPESLSETFGVAGAVLLWGCIFSPEIIDPEENTPVCLIHGGRDKILPVDSGYAFSQPKLPYVYGSKAIAGRIRQLHPDGCELHVFDDEPHALFFKFLYMFVLDKEKFNRCFQIATDFMERH